MSDYVCDFRFHLPASQNVSTAPPKITVLVRGRAAPRPRGGAAEPPATTPRPVTGPVCRGAVGLLGSCEISNSILIAGTDFCFRSSVEPLKKKGGGIFFCFCPPPPQSSPTCFPFYLSNKPRGSIIYKRAIWRG